jgi:organic hydroperoxide reductase OsmC/OhrA
MDRIHEYQATLKWTGNKGEGTKDYRSYERSHTIVVDNKVLIEGSADPTFRGDKTKYNPEDLLLCSLSACHMLTYLHLCAISGVNVIDYVDVATGIMKETPNGGGRFDEVTLHPVVTVTDESMIEKANQLHEKANELCFIARSVNFSVRHSPIAMTSKK